jgi:hypothetical protein
MRERVSEERSFVEVEIGVGRLKFGFESRKDKADFNSDRKRTGTKGAANERQEKSSLPDECATGLDGHTSQRCI